MQTYANLAAEKRVRLAVTLAGTLGLTLISLTANAQIDRSRNPQQNDPPSKNTTPSHPPATGSPNLNRDRSNSGGQGGGQVFSDRRGNAGGRRGQGNGNNPFNRNGTDFNMLFQYGPSNLGYDFNGDYNGYYSDGFGFGTQRRPSNLSDVIDTMRSPSRSELSRRPPSQQLPGGPLDYNHSPSYNRFQHSQEGFQFQYQNGLRGRHRFTIYYGWGGSIFPSGNAYYPYYAPTYAFGETCYSPYYYFSGSFPPYISLDYVYRQQPEVIYVPVPVYRDGRYDGYRTDDIDSYYLNREDTDNRRQEEAVPKKERVEKTDKVLEEAIMDIKQAWKERDIQVLSKHIRRDSRIAVHLRGKYQYSLESSDYLDMTRDAFRTTKTVRFELDKPKLKEQGVYTVTGRHIFKDKEGEERTIHVSYVLQKMDGEYVITQVGTAPDDIKEQE